MGYIKDCGNYYFCERIFIKISSSIAVSDVLRCILNSSHVLMFSTICENVSLKLTFAVNLILDLSMNTNHISPSFWRLQVRRLSSVCDREFSHPLVLFVNTPILHVLFYGLPAKVTIDKGKDFKQDILVQPDKPNKITISGSYNYQLNFAHFLLPFQVFIHVNSCPTHFKQSCTRTSMISKSEATKGGVVDKLPSDVSLYPFQFSLQCHSKPQAGKQRAWRTSYGNTVKNC